MSNTNSFIKALLALTFFMFFYVVVSAQKTKDVSVENAKGLYLTEILEIEGLEIRVPMGHGEVCFKIKDNFLYIADLVHSESLYLKGVNLHKVNLDNTRDITSATLDLSEHVVPTFSDISIIDDKKFVLTSRFGILEGEWVDTIASVTSFNVLTAINFLPTKSKVLNDSTLLVTSLEGGMYQSFSSGKTLPAGYAFYNLNTNSFSSIKPVPIKGSILINTNNHRFISAVGDNIVHSNGFNYTLYLEDAKQQNHIDTLHKKISDPYWVEVSEAEVDALNLLDKDKYSKQINRAYGMISSRVSNINGIHEIQGVENLFFVGLDYGFRTLNHRKYQKYSLDMLAIDHNKLKSLNSDINYPGSIRDNDTVDNKHHNLYMFDDCSFSNKYAVFLQFDYDIAEYRDASLSENGEKTVKEFVPMKTKLREENEPRKPYFYIYKYY